MPIYTYEVTVPPKIAGTTRITKYFYIEGDVLRKINILIPYGHQGLTGIRIRYGEAALVPYRLDEWIRGDGESLLFDVDWRLPETPCQLTIDAYSDDMCYPHTFYIRFIVEGKYELTPEKQLIDYWDKLFRPFSSPTSRRG